MKNVSEKALILLAFIATAGWGLWIHDRFIKPSLALAPLRSAVAPVPSAHQFNAPNFHSPDLISPKSNIWNEYRSTRQKVLKNDASLAAEYKELSDALLVYQRKLDDATIRADSRVEPILAKLEALRHPHQPVEATPSTSAPVLPK